MAAAGTVAVMLPGAFYTLRETQLPPVAALRDAGVPMAVATDCNPGTSPMTSLLLAMNMACTLFRMTPGGGAGRRDPQRRPRARARRLRHASPPGLRADLAIWDAAHPAELAYRIGFNPLHARIFGGVGMILTPGRRRWRELEAVWRGGPAALDPAARAGIEAAAARVAAAVAAGAPVYGVNTGFGKLASVTIPAGDTARLQRNLILSHCSGVGDPTPAPVVRLIMALKLVSLGRGASGVRWELVALLEAMLARGVTPVVPAQGSVGASGDLAPLAHMAAVHARRRRGRARRPRSCPAPRRSPRPASRRSRSRPRRGWR